MPTWNTLDARAPRIIAHRGASGYLPEHTLAGYALGARLGADVIEPDLVMSRDGVLHARHDLILSPTTDVASHADLAGRRDVLDGRLDWWVCDFDAAEIGQLRSVQRESQRPHRHDGEFPVPTFTSILALARELSVELGRTVGVYPEIKHPVFFRQCGLDPVPALVEALLKTGMHGPDAPVWLQCIDAAVLREAFEACGNPSYVLMDAASRSLEGAPALASLASWARGIAPDRAMLWDRHGNDSGLVDAAHAAGLEVHAWTFRDDADPEPFASPRALLQAAMTLGVDALFCDFPDTAVSVRDVMSAP
jgi:glycerophosphoryl diester phosphodiesterase